MPNCGECKHYVNGKCEYETEPSWSCHFEYAEGAEWEEKEELLEEEIKLSKAERREECKKGWIRDW